MSKENMWQPIEIAPSGDFSDVVDIWNGERICDCSWGRPEYAEDKPSGAGAIMSMNADMDGYFMK